MSTQITTAFVKQFGANVQHLAQQKGSRLRECVRSETQVGKSAFWDQIGKATAQKKQSRHSDTPQIDTPHARRRTTLVDYEYADLIDNEDKIRTLIDPTNDYSQAAVWSLGRAMDDEIIFAADGVSYEGEEGATSTVLPNSQRLGSVAATAEADLNVQALRRAKRKFDAADVEGERFCALQSSQLENLLSETEVTSADFNTVRALVMGELDTFLGFKFKRLERLNTQDSAIAFDETTGEVATGSGVGLGTTKALCWSKDGILLAVGKDISARISERDDKSYATQVYACMGLGAIRMEEEKVVQILCTEA
jgi:hypothetical protein